MTTFLDQAEAFLRTAHAAAGQGDFGPAFENARLAAELAGKHMLLRQGAPPKEHDISFALVEAGFWPPGEPAARLSKLLRATARGRYAVDDLPGRKDVDRALVTAQQVVARAADAGRP